MPCKASKSLSATNLANHHHFHCDLYLHYIYHGTDDAPLNTASRPSELAKAQFERGLDWETGLYKWLDDQELLLTVESGVLDVLTLQTLIEFDERDYFFMTGIAFWPPNDAFAECYDRDGNMPVKFGLAKPDLLEMRRMQDGTIVWRVIDAKSSKEMKTSHHVQIFFYHMCLLHLLPSPQYKPADTLAIWLPGSSSTPSFGDLKTVNTSLLSDALHPFFFERLPRILSTPRPQVKWHYNPLCRGCPFEDEDNEHAVRERRLGSMPNISLADAQVLEQLLAVTRNTEEALTDIEELHRVFGDGATAERVESAFPSTVKRAKRVLGIPVRKKAGGGQRSAAVEAARTREPQVIHRRNYTLPCAEDIALVLSLVQDPGTNTIARFCLSAVSSVNSFQPPPVFGSGTELIPALASTIRVVLTLRPLEGPGPRAQFYTFSTQERAALQRHLIAGALTVSSSTDAGAYADARLCIPALCDGAALLATTVQPLVLSGALLAFLGTKGARSKAELRACAERLGLPADGTVEQLRVRVMSEVERLKAEGGRAPGERTVTGELPRVVVVKREIEHLLALPVAGYWDLPEAAIVMLEEDPHILSDEEIFDMWKSGSERSTEVALQERNNGIYTVLQDLRRRVEEPGLLVNDARELLVNFMDLCQQDALRKLFFMQQFEVLARLTELWNARLDGCPGAPVLHYFGPNAAGHHEFRLVSGNVDASSDKTRSFFDYLLVEDTDDESSGVHLEALFDDLPLCGQVFPLNRWTKPRWDAQCSSVKAGLLIADVFDLAIRDGHTIVTLKTCGTSGVKPEVGAQYRLSPRLIDFNLNKVLSTLLELDLRSTSAAAAGDDDAMDPFLRLITNPRGFARASGGGALESDRALKMEAAVQSTFRQLQGLGSEAAGMLMLKESQRKAARLILSQRLAVVWGPPGTGKTHTITATLLRLLQFEIQRGRNQVIFLTAMTHAAIAACLSKLARLVECYRAIEGLDLDWLEGVSIEHVEKGADHPLPGRNDSRSYIYAGTVYQLYNFSKRRIMEVDCVVIDEAGQLSLGLAALALRALSPEGRVVIAGDSEQLAPILAAQYPEIEARLFGSILDCVMGRTEATQVTEESESQLSSSQESTVVQLTENFRLNQDLGDFVATIYSRAFHAQKSQRRHIATALKALLDLDDPEIDEYANPIDCSARKFLLSIAQAMLGLPQSTLSPPPGSASSTLTATQLSIPSDPALAPRPISLALLRLSATSRRPQQTGYEAHVRGEAAAAAALVRCLREACPEETVFVATPHRIQRHAVREALKYGAENVSGKDHTEDGLAEAMEGLAVDSMDAPQEMVVVDTVERLQGSEASFVICLFSHTSTAASPADLAFLLERRRLNVAISRAKTLCILVTSDEVLRPPVGVLANRESYKGYAFLRAFEERAWAAHLEVDLDKLAA